MKLIDQWFALTYNQIAVAILVAVLGIVNTLTVSITDRRRELGVMQAVGGLPEASSHASHLAIDTLHTLLQRLGGEK